MSHSLDRRGFLDLAAGACFGQAFGPMPALERPERVSLASWETIPAPLYQRPGRNRFERALRIRGTNGAQGLMPARFCDGFSPATVEILKSADLLDHGALYDLMGARETPEQELKTVDILCWDLHARMVGKPLHALLGTKRTRVFRYGDVRGRQPGYTPEAYAAKVAEYFETEALQAAKLHFPGAMHTPESISFPEVLETLRLVRKATGPEPVLAWDPYFRSAESATPSMDEARAILDLMAELDYAWIEGPLPPEPEETQMPKYAELTRVARFPVQPEGPGAIGDGSSVEAIKRWASAGAGNRFSTDVYLRDGITPVVRLLEWARRFPAPGITINPHWSWVPHLHLAMTCEEQLMPILEFPMSAEVPPEYFDTNEFATAPDWPGVYLLEE